jgi:hypothetical protein
MKILGYIVTEHKMRGIESFVEQVNSIELADSTKPILLISWKNAKKHPKYTNILDRKLDTNLFWTFSKSENRSDFERDLEKFYTYIFTNFTNNITYYYVNILKLRYTKIKKLYNIINSNIDKNIYINNKMVYIPFQSDKILGLSLQILSYCGIKQSKALSRIFKNSHNKQVDSTDRTTIKLERKLEDKKYVIPFLV